MFVDKVKVTVRAGDGGDGIVSFRHEKFVDRGGPDGGDGGNGGDVVMVASNNQNTLASFRYQKLLNADSGKPGTKRNRHGRSGDDLIVAVPVGTTILATDNTVLADLTEDGQRVVIAKGGKGGYGNAHFVSSRRQAPRVAERGEEGEEFQGTLELRMIADVGLVGLPNAGKSTLLASISNARPEIADYPFTTLRPNLGVVDINGETTLLFADIPGLIEGASEGKGLGDDFLRHVERTKVLVHLIDAYQDDVCGAYNTIQNELKAYAIDLTERPQIVALTKVEGLDAEIIKDTTKKLRTVISKDISIFAISAQSKQGVDRLLYEVKNTVEALSRTQAENVEDEQLPVLTLDKSEVENAWKVEKLDKAYRVTGRKIERFAARTDFTSYHGLQRLRDIMKKMGILNELRRQGIEAGDNIYIGPERANKLEY